MKNANIEHHEIRGGNLDQSLALKEKHKKGFIYPTMETWFCWLHSKGPECLDSEFLLVISQNNILTNNKQAKINYLDNQGPCYATSKIMFPM